MNAFVFMIIGISGFVLAAVCLIVALVMFVRLDVKSAYGELHDRAERGSGGSRGGGKGSRTQTAAAMTPKSKAGRRVAHRQRRHREPVAGIVRGDSPDARMPASTTGDASVVRPRPLSLGSRVPSVGEVPVASPSQTAVTATVGAGNGDSANLTSRSSSETAQRDVRTPPAPAATGLLCGDEETAMLAAPSEVPVDEARFTSLLVGEEETQLLAGGETYREGR